MVTTTVAKRREARMAGIVACAWDLAREEGIAGVSLHGLARQVGIRQPSLYEYFDSKHALYDAMFADGNRQLLERLDAVKLPRDHRAALKQMLVAFVGVRTRGPCPLRAPVPEAHTGLRPLARVVCVGRGRLEPSWSVSCGTRA